MLVHTGQHYDAELSDVFFDELELRPPDHRIEGRLRHATPCRRRGMMAGLEPVLAAEAPDLVLVYGDTNSTLAGALVAAKLGHPLGHVESGLRSFDRAMPEEVNRVVADVLCDLRFCPSETAVANLAAEGIADGVHLVGDVMVDVAAAFGPIAQRRSRRARAPGRRARRLRAGHRAPPVEHRPTRPCRPLVEVLEAVDGPLVFPLHPRTRAALERAGLLDRAARRRDALPAARLPRLHRAARVGRASA